MIERSGRGKETRARVFMFVISAPPTASAPLLLPLSQPFVPILLPSGHTLHFMPFTPVLQEHRPDICSQSSRTEPTGSQLHAAVEGARGEKKEEEED